MANYDLPYTGAEVEAKLATPIPTQLSELSDDSTHRLVTDTEKSTWNAKQSALSTQTAYTSKGSATKVPQITTNTLGQVTGITEVTITQPDISGKADKATTLAGYGITDAKIESGTVTLGSESITPITSVKTINSTSLVGTGDVTIKENVQADWNATSGDAVILNKPTIPDVTGKADKVTGATSGNFAALDGNGNLTDSGHKHGDYQTLIDSSHKLSADLIEDGTTNKVINVQADWEAATGSAAEILNKPSTFAPSSHTHGNIQDGGTLQTNDVTIANGDKIVVTDASDSNKIARTSAAFDGSTTNKYLNQKGEFKQVAYSDVSSTPSLGTAAAKDYTTAVTNGSSDLVTSGAVYTAIDNLPSPMVFRGSLGSSGATISALPVDGSATIGDTYKVITAGTYASQSADVGDTFICDSKTASANTWVLIPSGDEPSGTVTSVGVSNATNGGLTISGSPITTSVEITIGHTNVVTSGTASGSATKTLDFGDTFEIPSVTYDANGHITAKGSSTITMPANPNTDRYVNSASFADDTNSNTNNPVKMTLTRAGSDSATVTGNIPKVSSSSAGVAPKGATVSTQSQSTKFLREDGTWAAPSYTSYSDATQNASGLMSSTDKTKLDNVASGAEVNVQSNWSESDSSSDAFIQNKPAIENFYFVQGSSSQAGSSTSGSVRSTKWEGTITGITTPTDGLKIAYRIGGNKGVSTGGAVLSIDGGTTYYPVVYNVNTVVSTRYDIGSMLLLTFNNTQTATAYMESGVSSEITGCWQAMDYDSTSTYQIKGQYGTMTTTGATYRYRILFTSADGTQWVPSNTSTSTNATSSRTVNQTPIDPFGRIVYYNYTTSKSANATMTASYLYTQYLVTLGYSFNRTGAALTLTTYAPVYIKCAPQSNGSAIIDADNPYVQTLPTTADGKIYIFLGLAYSATQVEMYAEHPVYCYVDGYIRQWTNAPTVDISGKADKVTSATNGHFAGLDSNGNLTDSGKAASDFATASSVTTIEEKIPTQASSSNQLADKEFVNSSISTATATFKGTYNLVSDLSLTTSATTSDIASALATAVTGEDNNDYAFVQIPTADATPTEISHIDRYKFNGTAWGYEFSLNNSSFTAAQWAAINSGITSTIVGTISGKYEKPSGGIPASDMASAVQTSLGKADTALQSQTKANWNETSSSSDAYIQNKPTNLVSGVVSGTNTALTISVVSALPASPDSNTIYIVVSA